MLALCAAAQANPVPPCDSAGAEVHPAYGPVNGAPAVAAWRDADLSRAPACLGALRERMAVVVALAGRFGSPLSVEDMARRIGAISKTKGLRYWSVTDQDWRTLLDEAFALSGPDPERRRSDFVAEEVLSGRTLYTTQRDTRSTGLNQYRLVCRRIGKNRLVIESENASALRFLLFTLYAPEAMRVIHFLDRVEPGIWAVYTLSAVRSGTLEQDPRALINRAAAYHRFLAGVPADRDPPLAP